MIYWDWTTLFNLVPKNQYAWYQYTPGVSGHHIIYDSSGNNRHLEGSVTASPWLYQNQINGQPAWYFNGSGTLEPLVYPPIVTFKHAFIVAAFERETFIGWEGLLSGFDEQALIVGVPGTQKFLDLTTITAVNYSYRRAGVELATNNQLAPMGKRFAVIELRFPDGYTMDGINLGQDRSDATRPFKGWFAEALFYDRILGDGEMKNVDRYHALRYKVWRQNADFLNIFPFCFDYSSPFRSVEMAEVSEAEGMRGRDRKVRYLNDDDLDAYNLKFNHRHSTEREAAHWFVKQHRLHIPFWLDDKDRGLEIKCVRTGDFAATPTGTHRHDYEFSVKFKFRALSCLKGSDYRVCAQRKSFRL
jgi:hypothetical protein